MVGKMVQIRKSSTLSLILLGDNLNSPISLFLKITVSESIVPVYDAYFR